jgi:cytochrome c biogenesis protein CcmG/thiol:disulfide interchange protein DsbE
LVERKLPKLEVAGSRPVVRSPSMKLRLSPPVVVALIGVAALIGLLTYGVIASDPDNSLDEALARGETVAAPELELDRLSGEGQGTLADHRGKVVVLNVWASWCKPCREESPLLQRWHERMARDGRGTVLGIDALDASSDARGFVREYGLTYPMLRDPDAQTVQSDWGVVGYPETFVIDRRGQIVALARGPVDEQWMRDEVAPLLERGR